VEMSFPSVVNPKPSFYGLRKQFFSSENFVD
jgi:hypothetical protein